MQLKRIYHYLLTFLLALQDCPNHGKEEWSRAGLALQDCPCPSQGLGRWAVLQDCVRIAKPFKVKVLIKVGHENFSVILHIRTFYFLGYSLMFKIGKGDFIDQFRRKKSRDFMFLKTFQISILYYGALLSDKIQAILSLSIMQNHGL